MLTVEDKNFDYRNIPLVDCIKGNAMDAALTLKLYYLLEEKLQKHPVWSLIEHVIMPAVEEFTPIEHEGMLVDTKELAAVDRLLSNNIIDIEDALFMCPQVNKKDNLASTQDLAQVFYTREGGFELYPPDNTDKGAPSVNKDTLKIILDQINQELINRGQVGQ